MATERNSNGDRSRSAQRTKRQFTAISSKAAPRTSPHSKRGKNSAVHHKPSKSSQHNRSATAKRNESSQKLTRRALVISILIEIIFIVALCLRFDSIPVVIEKAAFGCTLLWLSNTDLKQRIIPNSAVIIAALIRIAYIAYALLNGLEHTGIVWNSLIGCAVIGVFAFVLSTMTERLSGREGLGGGDIKLLAVTGLYFGLEGGILILFFACVAALAGYAYRHNGSGTFPFGPSIALASGIVALI